MASQASRLSPEEYVVELGPGTGVITRALCSSHINPKRLVIIELDHKFVDQLKRDFPDSIVLHGDARNIKELLAQHNIDKIGAVFCCLPLLAMPDPIRFAIVNSAFEVIKREGAFILYTYGLFSPVSEHNQRAIGIKGRVAKRVWRNFPPARVWRYENA